MAASFSLPVDPRLNGSQKEGEAAPAEDEAPLGWDLDLDDGEDQPANAVEPDSAPASDEEGPLDELQLIHLPFCHSPPF